MAVLRMDHVGIIVDDLEAAIAFFAEIGLELDGEASLEDPLVDRVTALEGVRTDIAMMGAPGGGAQIELTKFHSPPAEGDDGYAPANGRGIRHVTFLVDDVNDTLARLQKHGAELVGELVNYQDIYLTCYVRGPAGIIVELAEKIG